MKEFTVYGNKYNDLFSDGISRSFGTNKIIKTDTGSFFASVLPLMVNPSIFEFEVVGTIEVDDREVNKAKGV